jgi:peptidoglycan hydrolase-like protein with peptidoglycan-binding domain
MEGTMGFRISVLIAVLATLGLFAGCATTSQPAARSSSPEEVTRLQDKVASLEAQVKQQQDENLRLKEQLGRALTEKKVIRMPNGKEIQTALKKAGYYKGDIDGQIGSKTKEAIQKFQSANGITPDGVVGSKTWQILSKYLDS